MPIARFWFGSPSAVVALAAAWSVALGACASSKPPPGYVVDDIDIYGTNALSESQIRKKILTSEKSWWPFTPLKPYDPADWHTDLQRIERLYEAHGYYNARVLRAEIVHEDPPSEESKGEASKPPTPEGPASGPEPPGVREIDLLVEVDEGQPVRIGEIKLGGIEVLPEKEQAIVRDELPVVVGEIFRESDWVESKSALRRRVRDLGYATAVVDGHAVIDVGTNSARLTLTVVPGVRYHFGAVEVRRGGEGHVDPAWIVEQVRLAIGWDRPFSDAALEEAQRRVFAMGVFSTARVTTGTPDVAGAQMPVVVEVREGPTHTLRLGGGIGIDQVRQEARLISEWTDRNFFGGLRKLSARAQVGWAFLPSTIAVLRNETLKGPRNGPIYRAGLDFEQPRLFGRPSLRGKSTIESERTLEQTYNSIGGRFSAGVSWEPRSTLTIFPSYNLQANWLRSAVVDNTGPSVNTAQAAPLSLGCKEDPCLVILSYLEQVATWDTRDSALEPRRGHYLSVSLQEGGGPLGGDFDYLRIMPEARAYVTGGSDDQFTLAGRLRVGTLLTRSGRPEDSAVVTRFYSGGGLGMRGFATRRLSPMLLVPTSPETVTDKDQPCPSGNCIALPIGGNGLFEGSLEGRAKLTESVVLAAFTDFGTVDRTRLPIGRLPHMLWAVGFGFRYLTPVGPIRLDLAFRLPVGRPPPLFDTTGKEITYQRKERRVPDPEDPTDEKKAKIFWDVEPGTETGNFTNNSCFGIGGNRDKAWVTDGLCAFHISIGEAF
ncbi:MAG TPA: BamA/TamA family outer membrane protein [Polyangia bacterium]